MDRALKVALVCSIPFGLAWWIYRTATWEESRRLAPASEEPTEDLPLEEFGAGHVYPAA